jgi:hypothetical protein
VAVHMHFVPSTFGFSLSQLAGSIFFDLAYAYPRHLCCHNVIKYVCEAAVMQSLRPIDLSVLQRQASNTPGSGTAQDSANL